jgi:hypothetical protein
MLESATILMSNKSSMMPVMAACLFDQISFPA